MLKRKVGHYGSLSSFIENLWQHLKSFVYFTLGNVLGLDIPLTIL